MRNQTSPFHHIGQLMCQATRKVLWEPASGWAQAHGGKVLVCRVGSGQATYHRFDARKKQHLINFGVRMIIAKHQPDTAHGWLSTREICHRGYFDGEVSPLNLLAHTCCHEFAHLLQQSAGQRRYGSVHNRHFYEVLDQLHENRDADAVRWFLAEQARENELHLPDTTFTLPDVNASARHWQPGDAVRFGEGARQREGRIIRVNRKTCTVDGTGASRGARYRVPVQMLSSLPPR